MNKENLKLLRDYLRRPVLQAHFDMRQFDDDRVDELVRTTCGTVGCALGHATYAVTPKRKGEDWDDYSKRALGIEELSDEWLWCFSDQWADVDNTPTGAAARIDYLLEHGELPGDWCDQMFGIKQPCYLDLVP